MRKLITFSMLAMLFACNNKKTDSDNTTRTDTGVTVSNDPGTTNVPAAGTTKMKLNIDGKDMVLNASALISKDDKNLQAGSPWFAMITGSDGPDDEGLILNFVFDLKPGTYPVVGVGLSRGSGDNGQVFGGLMGGEPKITEHKVTLTEVKNLGSNNIGGNKWSISGTFSDMTVQAMPIMLMDDTKKHPREVVIKGGSFSNITFDDNLDEVMEEALEKMKENN
jgi:hypothetical protein